MPDRVISIASRAFSDSALVNVAMPHGFFGIGEYAFSGCRNLTIVTIPASLAYLGGSAFELCTSLTAAYFGGNAPHFDWPLWGFQGAPNATVYFLPGTGEWDNTETGCPTLPWVLSYPVILTTTHNFGIQTKPFGFRISWATNFPVAVEVATTLVNTLWSPISTNTLTTGWTDLTDPDWVNHLSRFYRVRSH